MNEFAQTRQPDDLFDDDFTPVSEPVPQSVQQRRSQRPKAPPKNQSQKPQQAPQAQIAPDSVPADAIPPLTSPDQTSKPPPAVRGDRSATGGINKPKLTEDELSARLAAAKLHNAKREEAHRLAEADEASFQRREAQAQQKRKEEGAARRVMDQEREKNRLRKLAVKGGREWDEGKDEQDTRNERGSQFRRGAYGGVAYQSQGGSEQYGDPTDRGSARGRGRGRGRGERGRGGRGGRGRGGHENGTQQPPAVQREEGFPTLPAANSSSQRPSSEKPSSEKPSSEEPSSEKPPDQTSEPLMSPTGEKQSWADQVEKAEPDGGW